MQKFSLTSCLNGIILAGIVTLIAFPLALILPGVPAIWYRIDAAAVDKETERVLADLGSKPTDFTTNKQFVEAYRPKFDPTLPKENRVWIPSIHTDGQIYEGSNANANKVLAKGIWRTSDFGTPDQENVPTILASHRYGNPNWSQEFRDKEIFYNLDKVAIGDTIDIVWNQKLYKYKVYKTESGRKLTDLSFDLVLYTCYYWNSPDRIFVYAQRSN